METGSAITWKYPSCILQGADSVGEFYSVAVTNNAQQADTGTKMIHIGPRTKSTIIAKGIAAGKSDSTYRGLVRMMPGAEGGETSPNVTVCWWAINAGRIPCLISSLVTLLHGLSMKPRLHAFRKISCFIVCNVE